MIYFGSVTAQDGSEIYYSRYGIGKKKLFLLHGLYGDRKMWTPTLAMISDYFIDYQVIVPELRGHGRSENKNFMLGNYFFQIARDIDLIVQKELSPDDTFSVIAYSLGVPVMWAYVDQFTEQRIDKFMFIDHAADWFKCRVFRDRHEYFFDSLIPYLVDMIQQNPEKYAKTHLHLLPEEDRELVRQAFEIICESGVISLSSKLPTLSRIEVPRRLTNKIISIYSQMNLRWASYIVIGNSYRDTTHDFGAIARTITKPVTVLLGTKSKLFETEFYYDDVRSALPDADIYKFSDSGHDLMITQPIRFLGMVRRFL